MLIVAYKYLPLDQLLVNGFGKAGNMLAIVLMFHFTLIGWMIFMSPDYATLIVLRDNIIRFEFHELMEGHFYYMKIVVIFVAPIILLDLVAYIKRKEFIDVIESMPVWGISLFLVIAYYLIVIFGKRESYDFIYFAF